jgi:hypothetical protein
MQFPRRRFSAVDPALKWRYHGIAAGESVRGWIVGPMVVLDTHWKLAGAPGEKDHTEPCLKFLTRGALKCRCEELPIATRETGYVPFQTTLGEQIVFTCSKTTGRHVELIGVFTPCEFTRPKVPKAPLKVRTVLEDEVGVITTRNMQRRTPADITPWLLHLWGIPELKAYALAARDTPNHHEENGHGPGRNGAGTGSTDQREREPAPRAVRVDSSTPTPAPVDFGAIARAATSPGRGNRRSKKSDGA